MIGDTVTVTDKRRAEIKITGRTKHYLNVVGEQLSVNQMNEAIQKLEQRFDLEVKEFVACTLAQDGEYVLKWIIGTEKSVDGATAAGFIDQEIQRLNKNYTVARSKALKKVEAELVPVHKIYRWSEEFKKLGGQTKIPRVMKEPQFREFQLFLRSVC